MVTRKSVAFYWQELSNSITKKRDYAPLEKHNNQTAINQQSDNLDEDQFEDAEQQQKKQSINSPIEIVEDVV